MKSNGWLPVLAGALFGLAQGAGAVTIDSTYLFGKSVNGAPSGLADEPLRLTYLINQYNTSGATGPTVGPFSDDYTTYAGANVSAAPLPAYDGTSTGQLAGGWTSANIDLGVGGWDYLMVKWSDNDYFYDVSGLTGIHTISNDVESNSNGKAQDASHYRLFNQNATAVPDGGLTLGLLGLGIFGLGLASRRSAK